VPFIDEQGIGLGPTREFFQLFSTALVNDENLWRTDQQNGLFPRPAADPHMFWAMGGLCGKAIVQDLFVHLPVNPVFFEVIRGKITRHTYLKVDDHFIRSLEDRPGLINLQFVLPDQVERDV
jgi:hypothetical protein